MAKKYYKEKNTNVGDEIYSQRLNDLLFEKQITQKELSKMSGVKESTITAWIRSEYEPRIKGMNEIAKALGVSLDYLMGNTDIPSPNSEDLQAINKHTGLKLTAINNLHKYAQSKYYCDQMIIRYINVLLGDVGINLFPIIDEYIQSVKHCAFLEKLYPDIDFSTKASPIYLCTGTKTPIKKQPVENEAEIKQEYFAEKEGKQPVCLYTIQKFIVEFVERYGKVTADKFDIDKFVAEYKKIEESKTAKTDDIISALESLKGTFDSIKKKIDLIKEEGAENG